MFLLKENNLKLNEFIDTLEKEHEERIKLSKEIYNQKCVDIFEEHKQMGENAYKEYEEKKIYLKRNLIKQLEENKKLALQECQNMELNQESTDIKPVYTRRILRRRTANDLPYNGNDTSKRKKQPTPDILLKYWVLL
ncbi:sin3 histone deacetylase corepressor complex component SDS3-like isoform X1 [Gordionus sp. m RMFG-2023]|uniref:sin3 histone deacetylase corepressor complex component SDS3-like isoform X1 n=2 Tax=Gordionus sp. m RMFG-2023 TaxID=3053472 RepID=UPI0031FDE41A